MTTAELQLELSNLKKTIEELKMHESGVCIDLYAKQREVDNLRYALFQAEQTISEVLSSNKEAQDKLEKTLETIRAYTGG